MRLPRIYECFRKGQVFSIDEARQALGITGNTLRKRLCELASRGYVEPIRQGLYRLGFPDGTIPHGRNTTLAVASKISPFCYLGFKTALQTHAGESPCEGETLFVVSGTKFNNFDFDRRHFFWCQTPEPYGLETLLLSDDEWEFPLLVTNFEKSLVDCLKRPQHSPSFEEMVRLCHAVNRAPRIEKIFDYTCEHQVAALFNRVGYFLDRMSASWNFPTEILTRFQARMSRKQVEWPIECRSTGTTGRQNRPHDGPPEEVWRISFTGTPHQNSSPLWISPPRSTPH